MNAQANLKSLLAQFLLEQYKQEVAFGELEKRGVRTAPLMVNNLGIVIRAAGFPEDNSHEYDFKFEMGAPRDESKKLLDKNHFADDMFEEKYHNLTMDLYEEKDIIVSIHGVEVHQAKNLHLVSNKIAEYIDWLFDQYERYDRGEDIWKDFNETEFNFDDNDDEE